MEIRLTEPSHQQQKKSGAVPRYIIGSISTLILLAGIYFWFLAFPSILPSGYDEITTLVPQKLSISAPIPIKLPPGISKEYAQQNIIFTPEIKGSWASDQSTVKNSFINTAYAKGDTSSRLLYKPSAPLSLKSVYRATLTLADQSTIVADFQAVEDPAIIARFPKEQSEAPETARITIVFNRPMVPLTTLDSLDTTKLPITVTPITRGHFKWTTTRNLQFIPDTTLIPASNYTVTINNGLHSLDGLAVKGTSWSFTTKHLRTLTEYPSTPTFNTPVIIHYNQPVSLEKTSPFITLTNNTTNKSMPFVLKHPKNKNLKDSESETILELYNATDRFGRAQFWDFNNSYSLTITRALPANGTIADEQPFNFSFTIGTPIETVYAESPRSTQVDKDMFDPEGTLWVKFYEPINLDKTALSAPGIKDIRYGEQCVGADTDFITPTTDCAREQNKKKISITFNSRALTPHTVFTLTFERIVNSEGVTLNAEAITETITPYQVLALNNSVPRNNDTGASVNTLILCTNTPLAQPEKQDYKKIFTAPNDFEILGWQPSWKVTYINPDTNQEPCALNQFHTAINAGFMPITDYQLSLALTDVFGQTATANLKFTTGAMPSDRRDLFRLQQSYIITTPEKTKLTFAARNLEYVDLELCKTSPENFLSASQHDISYNTSQTETLNCLERITDTITLPKKYWVNNYFSIDLAKYFPDKLGNIIVTLTHPQYRIQNWYMATQAQQRAFLHTYVNSTNLVTVHKTINPPTTIWENAKELSPATTRKLQNLFWVTTQKTFSPIARAHISFLNERGQPVSQSIETNEQGIARGPLIKDLQGIIITTDNDSTVIKNFSDTVNYADNAYQAEKIYLYTDKPLYRPTQEVNVKGIYRLGYDGNFSNEQGKSFDMVITDARENIIHRFPVTLNSYGTFTTSITLSAEAPLGSYRACIGYQCAYFDVEEYVPSAFQITATTDKEEYISNDYFTLDLSAQYYFGVPVGNAQVTYTISSQNYYFDKFTEDYYSFSAGRSDGYDYYEYGDRFILRDKTTTDSEGKARIHRQLDLNTIFKNPDDRRSKIIVIDATVTNSGGQTVSTQKSFILHQGEYYLGIKAEPSFVGVKKPFTASVQSVDQQGKKISIGGATASLYKISWNYNKRQEADGGYSYKWTRARTKVQSYSFSTNSDGQYQKEFTPDTEGEYELEASATDRNNNSIRSTYSIYVYGSGQASYQPTNDTSLTIKTNTQKLSVGDTAKLLITSPSERAKALISIERGDIYSYEIVDITGNFYEYSFPVKDTYAPNVYASVALITPDPHIKFGSQQFNINTAQKELTINVKSDKHQYLPGEKVSLAITTTDYKQQPVSAELSFAVVDLSVLALKGNPKKDPLIFFYNGFPLTVLTGSNIKNELTMIDIPNDYAKGGGGLSPEELSRKARGVFKETAFWAGQVTTDNTGTATVNFTLPDNLTTWRTEAIGVTDDSLLGVNYSEFTARKDLMVVPLKPRFLIPGDRTTLGATIFNQTDQSLSLSVEYTSDSLPLFSAPQTLSIRINPKKSTEVYFPVQAPTTLESGTHRFTITASNATHSDAVTSEITIAPNLTYETTATAFSTNKPQTQEYLYIPETVNPAKGGLTVTTGATLAVYLMPALQTLLDYPHGYTIEIADKLSALAIAHKGVSVPKGAQSLSLPKIKYDDKYYTPDEAITIGLQKLSALQSGDGGFSFWPQGPSSFYATLAVMDTLAYLAEAGYSFNATSRQKAISYLATAIATQPYLLNDSTSVIYFASVLAHANLLTSFPNIASLVNQYATDARFVNDKASIGTLVNLAYIGAQSRNTQLLSLVTRALDNNLIIDARGAHLEAKEQWYWQGFETPIKNTAVYLKALTLSKKDSPIADKLIRWIVQSRDTTDAWGSTRNTLAVIDAFAEYLNWKKETNSQYSLTVTLDTTPLQQIEFTPATVFQQFVKVVGMQELSRGKNSTITFSKTNLNDAPNTLYYDLALKYFFNSNRIAPRDEGFSITNELFSRDDKKSETPLTQFTAGDVVKRHLVITVPTTRMHVGIEDFIPAGFEIINDTFATQDQSVRLTEKPDEEITSKNSSTDPEIPTLYPQYKELKDDRAFFYLETLEPGVYQYDYYLRALTKGTYAQPPATISELYFPENFGRSAGKIIEVK